MKTHNAFIYHCLYCGNVVHSEPNVRAPQCCGIEMVKAAALGQDLDDIARWTSRTPATVRRWLAAFQAGGLGALTDAPRQGRPLKADAAYLAALEAALETPPRTLGLPFDVWTSERLSAYLLQQTGVRIAPGWLRPG